MSFGLLVAFVVVGVLWTSLSLFLRHSLRQADLFQKDAIQH